MSVSCCGTTRTTNFCPECGGQLEADGQRGLWRHLKTQVRNKEKWLVVAEKPGQEHLLKLARINLAKWAAWLAAFELLLAERAEKEDNLLLAELDLIDPEGPQLRTINERTGQRAPESPE